ncbi:MAG: pyridoxamine 5'-phosphate oxidase family protein [Leptolyngbyaceae cyanobacterium MO_188.B28]|nr:pyridoxamine 5'-phosphate oxidase family protein [Leptolyngbyaceae cyanobacterium MO_188.B28]
MQHEKDKGWTQGISPFHGGEQAIQTRLGVRDRMENIGRRFIREFMLDTHRKFYEQLPFVILGSVDAEGRPWASLISGQPGFIAAPDAVTLQIQARPLSGDPLNHTLRHHADIGLLGIELETRRRNRMNGRIQAVSENGFAIAVTQSFGNCPQYIQKRQLSWLSEQQTTGAQEAQHFSQLTQPIQQLIANADTLFIASRYTENNNSINQGVDVSHRGGKPGFVRIEDERTFIFPNFTGNSFYNTLGNLLLDNRVGILFLDFEAGDLISITGQADIIWESEELKAFDGAEQLVRITSDKIVYLPEALPFRWDFQEYSPSLAFTGEWSKTKI